MRTEEKTPIRIDLLTPLGCLYLYGGKYVDKPAIMKGVKMAAEIDKPCAIDIPTEDFSVPEMEDLFLGVVRGYLLIRQGEEVYAGCWGGIGRTGLYLSVMVKTALPERARAAARDNLPTAVANVRGVYSHHAVETQAQIQMVEDFDSVRAKKLVFGSLWKLKAYVWYQDLKEKLLN
jgi:hypothetical protein